ncbi:hypothetical protein GGI64_001431 [Rhizobium leguminosarum]|uniref:Uncharacterized protein n=2 Tax=Rhizobium leguminosarum TaxID=384 RepID=A0A7Z0IXC8_RHILE|nr:hypothetical protein [Rhizobium leguminosarum]MBB5662114.1 hypothetical protein [Rhizobium leguminosarum]NYJ10384.1 hypothetical protein [Rhizobium leguminosarum]
MSKSQSSKSFSSAGSPLLAEFERKKTPPEFTSRDGSILECKDLATSVSVKALMPRLSAPVAVDRCALELAISVPILKAADNRLNQQEIFRKSALDYILGINAM